MKVIERARLQRECSSADVIDEIEFGLNPEFFSEKVIDLAKYRHVNNDYPALSLEGGTDRLVLPFGGVIQAAARISLARCATSGSPLRYLPMPLGLGRTARRA
jgi:hypothetical protein